MAIQPSWWRRLLVAVSNAYERRIRAASLLSNGGTAYAASEDDAADAEIVNLPPGARLGSHKDPNRFPPLPTAPE